MSKKRSPQVQKRWAEKKVRNGDLDVLGGAPPSPSKSKPSLASLVVDIEGRSASKARQPKKSEEIWYCTPEELQRVVSAVLYYGEYKLEADYQMQGNGMGVSIQHKTQWGYRPIGSIMFEDWGPLQNQRKALVLIHEYESNRPEDEGLRKVAAGLIDELRRQGYVDKSPEKAEEPAMTDEWSMTNADKLISDRLDKLHPMLSSIRAALDDAISYRIFYKQNLILEVRLTENALSFPFTFSHDQLASELKSSLMYNTMLKAKGAHILKGADLSKADDFLDMAMTMFGNSGGAFPNYDNPGNPAMTINQILVLKPSPSQGPPAPPKTAGRKSKRRQEKIAQRERDIHRLRNEQGMTIADIAEKLGVSEKTVSRTLEKSK